MQSNFWAGSKNLDPHKTFWYLKKDKALQNQIRKELFARYKLTLVSFFKNVNKQDPRAQNEWKIVAQD